MIFLSILKASSLLVQYWKKSYSCMFFYIWIIFNVSLGDELEAFFDKEEKLYASSSSVNKSDQGEKSSVMASGITMR